MKIRSYLLLVLSLIFMLYILFEYQNNSDKKLIKKSFIQKAESTFYEKDELLNGYIGKFENTLFSIKDNKYFQNYISSDQNQNYIKELFLSSMKSLPEIVQFRYIDIYGNENIRLDKLQNNQYKILQKNQLQNKKHRYYFKEILNKQKNQIWYSNIDLNVEYNKIVKPIQPTLRIGVPIDIDGIKKGILIININIENFLDKLIKSSNYNIYLIDKDGYFIKDPNNKYSWGKYLQSGKTIYNTLNLSKDFIQNGNSGDGSFFIKDTSFKNGDDLKFLMEIKISQIDEQIKDKRGSRALYFIGAVMFILLVSYIIYNKKYTNLLEKHNQEIDKEKKKIKNILDSQNSIVILTDGESLLDGNKRFLDFFGFDNIEKFKGKHRCICEFFETDDKHKYLQEFMDDKLWSLYILINPQSVHKAKISDIDGNTHIFIVNIKEYETKSNTIIITFSDVSELEFLKNNLEDAVYEKTQELRDLNQNLELCIRQEVEKNRDKDKQLFEREKMAQMGEMIGNIAHQWRQPLSTISTCASGMQIQDELGILDSKMLDSNLDTIVKTSQFLSNTIDDFRDFINEDKNQKSFNLKDTINQVILNILNNAKDILLEKKISDKVVEIKTLVDENHRVLITIEDNAGGVPKDIMPKIFDPYFTTKHQSTGTGIGLYMSHKIVTKDLKGKLYVQNTKKGAKFFIELPLTL